MALFSVTDIDSDVLAELLLEFGERREAAELLILELEQDTANVSKLNALFREIHTIKGNLGLVGVTPPVLMLQKLEDLLHLIRSGDLKFEPLVGDITLLLVDRCANFLDECAIKSTVEYDKDLYNLVAKRIEAVRHAPDEAKKDVMYQALAILDPQTEFAEQVEAPDVSESVESVSQLTSEDADLLYMLNIAEQTQYRATFWQGKLERVLQMVLELNKLAGKPVVPSQLVAAVCAHDIAMGFLPIEMLTKTSKLSEIEKPRMQSHVRLAAELLSYYPKYEQARLIVTHHHEHFDGGGYPAGLSRSQITPGAQILAIAHTFEAITHGYSRDSNRKRPLMRAVMELSRFAGQQFDPMWVEHFLVLTRQKQMEPMKSELT